LLKAEVYWFTLYAGKDKGMGFPVLQCVFTLVNVVTAAYTLDVHICECRSFKG